MKNNSRKSLKGLEHGLVIAGFYGIFISYDIEIFYFIIFNVIIFNDVNVFSLCGCEGGFKGLENEHLKKTLRWRWQRIGCLHYLKRKKRKKLENSHQWLILYDKEFKTFWKKPIWRMFKNFKFYWFLMYKK